MGSRFTCRLSVCPRGTPLPGGVPGGLFGGPKKGQKTPIFDPIFDPPGGVLGGSQGGPGRGPEGSPPGTPPTPPLDPSGTPPGTPLEGSRGPPTRYPTPGPDTWIGGTPSRDRPHSGYTLVLTTDYTPMDVNPNSPHGWSCCHSTGVTKEPRTYV